MQSRKGQLLLIDYVQFNDNLGEEIIGDLIKEHLDQIGSSQL